MLELALFKTLWGHEGTLAAAINLAVRAGFDGIEGQAPANQKDLEMFRQQLTDSGLKYIAEITTAGTYVPDRQATPGQHLESFNRKLEQSMKLGPEFVTTLAGCDAWEEAQSVDFFGQIMELASATGIQVSIETHRSRSFFNPWTTARICRQLPELNLTFDFSHWCVVCERLMDTEMETLTELAPRAFHIHARVGYDQGPQVPDPRHPRFRHEVERHQAWWEMLWLAMIKRGMKTLSMTPEFGPDGYQSIDLVSEQPVGDLWEINQWMGHQQQLLFEKFKAGLEG